MLVKVSNIKLELGAAESSLVEHIAARLRKPADAIARCRILRKSLDARSHDDLHYVYTAEAEVPELAPADLPADLAGVSPCPPNRWRDPEPGTEPAPLRPLVVGAGPAGLFAAYLLAKHGYAPLILERGKDVKDRVADVRAFDRGGALDPESNYLFGEGGAGTFSDGKLTYRSSGPDVERALEILVECRAKPSILYEHRPHLGSNRLPLVVKTLRRKIEELGGSIAFSHRVDDLTIADGAVAGVETAQGPIAASAIILAMGHSARDTYEMLQARGVPLEFKPFQFGARIEHDQARINRARFGPFHDNPELGAADYELVARGRRNLFTFCMCAGGYVMPSVSEPGMFCTNGMSESRHDSGRANSGLVITIERGDLEGDDPLAGIRFQRKFEGLAFAAAGGDYRAPIQWTRDFLAGKSSRGTIASTYPRGTATLDLAAILPEAVVRSLRAGLPILDRQMHGQFLPDATLTGPEARGSSPVRIPRGADRQSIGIRGLYPCGEGAGYAGGIMSAAVDGLRTARAIIERYAPIAAK